MDQAYKRYFKTVGVLWAGCFSVLAVVYFFALLPQEPILVEIKGQLSAKQLEYRRARIAASDKVRNRLQKEAEKLKADLDMFITDLDKSGSVMFDVGQLVSGMQVSSFANKGKTTKSSFLDVSNCVYLGEVSFWIEFTSDFNEFMKVINVLERHRPVVFVDRFSITRSRSDNVSHKVGMTLSLYIGKPLDEEDTGQSVYDGGRADEPVVETKV